MSVSSSKNDMSDDSTAHASIFSRPTLKLYEITYLNFQY